MRWRVLVSAPYKLLVIEEFRPRLEAEGIEIVTTSVKERLSEEELLLVAPTIDGPICGDDQFTAQVLRKALNRTSFHLTDRAALLRMRPSTYLINTARGPVIDEPALVDALREQRIAGAALDVFETEPLPADSPLRRLENCLLAPHNANNSRAGRRRVHESTVANLLKGLRELA